VQTLIRWIVPLSGTLGMGLLVVTLTLASFHVFAQGQARVDLPAAASSSLPDNWTALLGGLFTMVGGVAIAWVNAGSGMWRRQAEVEKQRADSEKQRADKAEAELDAVEKERDRLYRYAVKHGYDSDDNIPVRKEPS
jgi:hypothetical protein